MFDCSIGSKHFKYIIRYSAYFIFLLHNNVSKQTLFYQIECGKWKFIGAPTTKGSFLKNQNFLFLHPIFRQLTCHTTHLTSPTMNFTSQKNTLQVNNPFKKLSQIRYFNILIKLFEWLLLNKNPTCNNVFTITLKCNQLAKLYF